MLGNPGFAESFEGTAAFRASDGSLSASAHGAYSGSPVSYTPGTTIADSVAAATFSDLLTASVANAYTDVSSDGFVRYRFTIDGSMTTPPPHGAFYGGEALTAFDIQQGSGPTYSLLNAETSTDSVGSFNAQPGGTAGWVIGPGTVVGGSILESPMFSIDLLTPWSMTAGLIVNAYGNANDNFYSTARLVGVASAPIPETGTLPLMVTGMLACVVWRMRRARA